MGQSAAMAPRPTAALVWRNQFRGTRCKRRCVVRLGGNHRETLEREKLTIVTETGPPRYLLCGTRNHESTGASSEPRFLATRLSHLLTAGRAGRRPFSPSLPRRKWSPACSTGG